LQGARCAWRCSWRCEPRARQFERTNVRSLSRSLFDRLGAAARWPGAGRRRRAAKPANVSAGRAGPAQGGRQHRLPNGGIDPAGEHHESRAGRETDAHGSGVVCSQSESASARCSNRIGAAVEKITQAGRQSAGASSCADNLNGARDGGGATGPGVDAGASGAACASGCDGTRTGGELCLQRSRAGTTHPVRVAAVNSTSVTPADAAARGRRRGGPWPLTRRPAAAKVQPPCSAPS
jgi:hypothetical protein